MEEKPDPYIAQVEVALPSNKKISAGYGVRGKGKTQDARLVGKLAEEAGLEVVSNKSQRNLEFSLKAQSV